MVLKPILLNDGNVMIVRASPDTNPERVVEYERGLKAQYRKSVVDYYWWGIKACLLAPFGRQASQESITLAHANLGNSERMKFILDNIDDHPPLTYDFVRLTRSEDGSQCDGPFELLRAYQGNRMG